ncbi:VOC family protein [Micromonospora globbae]|uniref:Glyoxalase n=1 Tax=Micromonospora globbae TaxID=1894969 RepID=A0ABZ1SGA5_9ACTN|nr:hypothetical protein [Micromonospora globbae]
MQTFINLPVRDLPTAKRFHAALGFGFNPRFSDNMEAVTINDQVSVLLQVEPNFQTFTKRQIVDAATSSPDGHLWQAFHLDPTAVPAG